MREMSLELVSTQITSRDFGVAPPQCGPTVSFYFYFLLLFCFHFFYYIYFLFRYWVENTEKCNNVFNSFKRSLVQNIMRINININILAHKTLNRGFKDFTYLIFYFLSLFSVLFLLVMVV